MRIIEDVKLDYSDVLLVPKRSKLSSRKDVNLIRYFKPKYGNPFNCCPIISANMACSTFDTLRVFMKYDMCVAIPKYLSYKWIEEYNIDPRILHNGMYTIGMSDSELNTFGEFFNHVKNDENQWYSGLPNISENIKLIIDIANGYTQSFADFVSKVRSKYPKLFIAVGNVCTPDMVQELILAGADAVKIGIGSGANCSTRRVTSIGYPQLSAVIECGDAAHGLGGFIIADGGIRTSGDFSKGICAGADFIMSGSYFSGTDESDGEIITKIFKSDECEWKDGTLVNKYIDKKYKLFYGMSSEYAQEKHGTGMKEYRASEGVVTEVEYKGSVESIIKDLLGGIRSTGTYIGADNIKNFGKCSNFIRVNRVHDRNI